MDAPSPRDTGQSSCWQPEAWLQWLNLRFELRAMEDFVLPPYEGSTLRGMLGHALKRLVCVLDSPHCPGCPLSQTCAYPRLFETLPTHRLPQRGADIPHPYLLRLDPDAPRHYPAGASYRFGLVLIGRQHDLLPPLIQAFQRAGRKGLGRGRARFQLARVWQQTTPGGAWQEIHSPTRKKLQIIPMQPIAPPQQPRHARIHLITPLRIKRLGHLLHPQRFRLGDLLWSLRQRLTLLQQAYGPSHLPNAEACIDDGCLDCASPRQDLTWFDWTRYSNRQKTHMKLGGLMGQIQLPARLDPDCWKLLWLGQWLHAGKTTSMGLGRYRIEPITSLAHDTNT